MLAGFLGEFYVPIMAYGAVTSFVFGSVASGGNNINLVDVKRSCFFGSLSVFCIYSCLEGFVGGVSFAICGCISNGGVFIYNLDEDELSAAGADDTSQSGFLIFVASGNFANYLVDTGLANSVGFTVFIHSRVSYVGILVTFFILIEVIDCRDVYDNFSGDAILGVLVNLLTYGSAGSFLVARIVFNLYNAFDNALVVDAVFVVLEVVVFVLAHVCIGKLEESCGRSIGHFVSAVGNEIPIFISVLDAIAVCIVVNKSVGSLVTGCCISSIHFVYNAFNLFFFCRNELGRTGNYYNVLAFCAVVSYVTGFGAGCSLFVNLKLVCGFLEKCYDLFKSFGGNFGIFFNRRCGVRNNYIYEDELVALFAYDACKSLAVGAADVFFIGGADFKLYILANFVVVVAIAGYPFPAAKRVVFDGDGFGNGVFNAFICTLVGYGACFLAGRIAFYGGYSEVGERNLLCIELGFIGLAAGSAVRGEGKNVVVSSGSVLIVDFCLILYGMTGLFKYYGAEFAALVADEVFLAVFGAGRFYDVEMILFNTCKGFLIYGSYPSFKFFNRIIFGHIDAFICGSDMLNPYLYGNEVVAYVAEEVSNYTVIFAGRFGFGIDLYGAVFALVGLGSFVVSCGIENYRIFNSTNAFGRELLAVEGMTNSGKYDIREGNFLSALYAFGIPYFERYGEVYGSLISAVNCRNYILAGVCGVDSAVCIEECRKLLGYIVAAYGAGADCKTLFGSGRSLGNDLSFA